jgi:hypothetical protein
MFNPVAAKDIEVGNMIVENTRPLEIGLVTKVTLFPGGEEVSIETDAHEHITGTFALYMAAKPESDTCEYCEATIIPKLDSTGQRGLAWAETDEDFMDYAFQCGLSPDNRHAPAS